MASGSRMGLSITEREREAKILWCGKMGSEKDVFEEKTGSVGKA